MENEIIHKSNYLLRAFNGDYIPFRPNIILINDRFLEYKKRNWFLISVDTQTYHFQNVIGIDVDKHLFGASLKIITSGKEKVYVHGFTKKTADFVKQNCSKYISMHSQRDTTEALASAIASAVGGAKVGEHKISPADELKKMKDLLDSGVISQSEYDIQKLKILNN